MTVVSTSLRGARVKYPLTWHTQVALLTLVAGAAIYARTMMSPLQEAVRTALALSDNEMAMLQGPALALPLLLGAAPLGLAIDRYSRVRLLLLCGVLSIVGSALTALAPNFGTLFISRCVIGLTAPATAMAAASLIADICAPAQRGRVNMLVTVGQTGSMAGAFALGGVLLASFGAGPTGWRQVVLVLTSPLLLITLLVPLMGEPLRTDVEAVNPSPAQSIAELWRYRAVVGPVLIGFALVAAIADGATLVWVAPTLSRRFALPPDRIGTAMGLLLLVSGILGPLVGGAVADFCQRAQGPRLTITALAALTLLSVPAGLFAVAPGVTAAIVGLVLFLTIGTATGVIVTTLLTIIVPNEVRGLSLSALWTSGAILGLGVAPVAVSLLSNAMGGPAMIGDALATICVGCSLAGAIAFAVGSRAIPTMTPPK
jgi:MFS family permease